MPNSIDIEIVLKQHYKPHSKNHLITIVSNYLQSGKFSANTVISDFPVTVNMTSVIHSVIIGKCPDSLLHRLQNGYLDFSLLKVNWYVYSLDSDGTSTQTETDDDGQEICLAIHLTLPSKELHTLWENLYYENNIKENLLKYAQTMMTFAGKGINPNIISCNRVILLHGPPGTGKTSLCKALAQKLSIKMGDQYSSGLLIEINSHSLFSKWFSESAKLVSNMFMKVKEICENQNILVCVLIDEVESLARARDQCASGTEPSDAVRVVNAVLTQIDQIKHFPNVLILTTSNMTNSIDLAFVDRADIKQFLGLPSIPAIYKIYHSCLMELIKTGIIQGEPLHLLDNVNALVVDGPCEMQEHSRKLIRICENSINLSGRTLRKIPFLAHALFLTSQNVTLEMFLEAMDLAVDKEHKDRKLFSIKQESSSQ